MEKQPDPTDQDTLVFTSEESKEEPFNTAINTTSDDSAIVMDKPVTTAFISDQVRIPTEKVDCLQVTSQLQDFLDHFPPKSIEKAFKHIYEVLQVLGKYLMKWIKETLNYAVYIYIFPSISPINPNHFINLLREIPGK